MARTLTWSFAGTTVLVYAPLLVSTCYLLFKTKLIPPQFFIIFGSLRWDRLWVAYLDLDAALAVAIASPGSQGDAGVLSRQRKLGDFFMALNQFKL